MFDVGEIIEGEIESLAFGGDGILRYHGFVIFVPFTAVGDHLLCQITEKKHSFAKGLLVELKKPSSYRTSPFCPYFGICGGCQLQHLQQDAQLKYKLDAVKQSLKRIGHLSLPTLSMTPAPSNCSYRRHVTLHLKGEKGTFIAGYIGIDNRSVIPIDTCPIFNSPNDPILKDVQSLVGQLPNPSHQEGRLMILKNQRGQFILSFFFSSEEIQLKFFQDALQRSPKFAGILIQTPHQQFSLGEIICEEFEEGLTFRFSPQTFIQNYPEQSLNIYRRLCSLAKNVSGPILDLYCGFGMSSLMLANQGHSVIGVEYNPEAIRLAKENAQANHLSHVDFIQGDVEKLLPKCLKTYQPQLVLVNPPRQGLTKTIINQLLKTRPKYLMYVSCMPSTLARDLKLLCQEGYRLQDGAVYDMFPQTAHVETLIYLIDLFQN